MRILFAGTPEIALPSLEALASVHDVAAVLTAPDRVSGRGRKVLPPAVKTKAESLGLQLVQCERIGSDARDLIRPLAADLLVVFAYGRIFGPKFLSLFPEGGINMHPSALPLFRGPAPITAAILGGEKATALTVQRIALEMDAGDILRQTPFTLTGNETTASLTSAVADAAAGELLAAVDSIAEGTAVGMAQNHDKATYCQLVRKEDGIIDWKLPATGIERMVRAYSPWPKARTSLGGEGLAILESSVFTEKSLDRDGIPGTFLGVDKSGGILIQTGDGVLGVTRLQLASRKPLDFNAFLNGVSLEAGTILGEAHET